MTTPSPALQEALAAVRADPKDASAWLRLGNLLAEAGDNPKALEAYERAMALDPVLGAMHQGPGPLPSPDAPLPLWLQGMETPLGPPPISPTPLLSESGLPASLEAPKAKYAPWQIGLAAFLLLCVFCFACALLASLGNFAGPAEEATTDSPTVTSATPSSDEDSSSETVSAFDIEVGDCFADPEEDEISDLAVVPCNQPHDYEAYHLADYDAGSDEPFPGEEAVEEFANDVCIAAFEGYVGTSYEDSELFINYLQPTEGTWENGDREVVCTLFAEDEQLVGSMEGSNR